jgi:hypothetical protein
MFEKYVQASIVFLATEVIVFATSYLFNDKSCKAVLANHLESISTQAAEWPFDKNQKSSG